MPIIKIGRERESLVYTGEAFKNAVRLYLESQGYSQTTDSYTEGHFQDMVFVNREVDPGRLFYVEAKASMVSLAQRDFCKELMNYLLLWLRLPREKRFKLLIFIQEASKMRRWEVIFGDEMDELILDEWIEKNKRHLSDKERLEFEEYSRNEILSFFRETCVYIAPAYKLEIVAEEKRKTSALSPSRMAKNLLEESERRNHLIKKKCRLISNLMKVELPEHITVVPTTYKNPEKILEIFPHPFKMSGSVISTFCPPARKTFEEIASGELETIETQMLMSSNPQELVKLVNYHLKDIMRFRGLRPYNYLYFFEPEYDGDIILDRWIETKDGKKRRVARPMFKEIENSDSVESAPVLNYVYHSAVKVSAKIYWGRCYIQISPVRHYTTDGITPIEGEYRDRLDRTFRNPIYNRNPRQLSWIKFWKYYLFERHVEDKSKECWFKRFKFGDFESIDVVGIPQSIEKDQRIFPEFGEEDED
jgi:hypothetical protein